MTRALQNIFVLIAALACVLFASSCNLMEGINQTSPNYRNPLPFSTSWWDAVKIQQKKRELYRIEQDWGVHKLDFFNPNKL